MRNDFNSGEGFQIMTQKIGFDREKYIELQSKHIHARREEIGGKLYLEMGGKLFDDMHASRVLPGFTPVSYTHLRAHET